MSINPSVKSCDNSAHGSLSAHRESFPLTTVPNPVKEAVRVLVRRDGRRAVLALLGNCVTWSAVRHWCEGRRATPEWVRHILANELDRHRAIADRLRA